MDDEAASLVLWELRNLVAIARKFGSLVGCKVGFAIVGDDVDSGVYDWLQCWSFW